MAYLALYRKFRPQEFAEVKGQNHIVTTLKNQIKTDRIGHAYLFTGTRGTGKTTVAKIFAKAVNCEHPLEDGSPCGICSSCKAITEGRSLDVTEIDAASNNGVENIRDIIDGISYPPSEGKYKVYIIDEVHMLSKSAFNAFLKSLEEPPEYVIFILATTEVQAIPITILSRCQRYEFHRISIDTIAARLTSLMEQEQVEIDEKAIRYIAKVADGSMRDALSLMDQCIAFYLGQRITYDNVLKVLGAVDTEIFSKLLRSIHEHNVIDALSIIEAVVVDGKELSQFMNDFIWYLRNLLLIKSSEGMEEVLDMSTENLALLKEEAQMIQDEFLLRYIRILSTLSNQLRNTMQKRVLVEVAVIKLCRPQMEEDYDSLLERVDMLETKVEEGITYTPVSGQPVVEKMTEPSNRKKELPEALPEDIQKIVDQWDHILQAAEGVSKRILQMALVTINEKNELMLVFDARDNIQRQGGYWAKSPEQTAYFENLFEKVSGKKVRFEIRLNEEKSAKDKLYTDVITTFGKKKNLTIEEEDF